VATSPLADVSLNLVETLDDALELKRWLGQRRDGPLAIDTESGGLSPWHHRLRLIQVGDKQTGWAIPWDRWGGAALEVMNAWDGEWTAHNGIFDWKFIAHHTGFELPWNRLHDTLTQARLDDPSRANGLKPLSSKLIDRRASSGQKALDEGFRANKWGWDTVPVNFAPYWLYSSLDPVLTAHLHEHFSPRIAAACPEAYSLERSANRICTMMMMKGLQLDVPYVEKSIDGFDKKSDEIRDWLASAHKITSPKSGGQLRRAFEALGQKVLFWTERSAPQFDKEALTFYEKSGENTAVQQLAQMIRAVRHIEDIRDRYSTKFLELRDADDIVHCNINTMGARTSRMSASDPALQQLPRDDKVIRGSFIPRPGYVFISCDLDQVEARLLAAFSDDPGLIGAFLEAERTGIDFFTTVGRGLYHDPAMVKEDPRRQLIKNSTYSKAYGGGIERIAFMARISVEEAQAFEDMFNSQFPGMRRMMNQLEGDAKAAFRRGERGGVTLSDGRFLPCDQGKEYAVLNYKIQGEAARYMKVCLANLDAAGLTEFMCLPVHDEILLEVPAEQAEEILKIVEDCMTDRKNFQVPLTAGGKIMTERWQK
jgi:DNA polymerase-1